MSDIVYVLDIFQHHADCGANDTHNFGSLFHMVSSKQSINHYNKKLAFDFQLSMPHIFEFATFILH